MRFFGSRRLRVRCILYVVFVLFTALVQNSVLNSRLSAALFGLIPLVISAAIFDHEIVGLFLGILAGGLWDISSDMSAGILTFFLAAVGFISGILIRYWLRNNFRTLFLLNAAACAIFFFISYLGHYSALGLTSGVKSILVFYLPSYVLTCLLSSFFYYTVRHINMRYPDVQED